MTDPIPAHKHRDPSMISKMSPAEQEEEDHHFARIIRTFLAYESQSMCKVEKSRRDYESLPKAQQLLIPEYLEKLARIEQAIKCNQQFIRIMLDPHVEAITECLQDPYEPITADIPSRTIWIHKNPEERGVTYDMDNVHSILRQFVRDWSDTGHLERISSYFPLLKTLDLLYNHLTHSERGLIKVLVPGAGLGRLAYEIARRGFTCQGNEFSLYMLLASEFALNTMASSENEQQYHIYPYLVPFSNNLALEDQLRSISIPGKDLIPPSSKPLGNFSMVAGDFLEVYSDSTYSSSYDVIVTSFFMDTAKNILAYLQQIYRLLTPGGHWLNLGPLLYHFEGSPNEISIELSLEEFKMVIERVGFVVQEERMLNAAYVQNEKSMLQTSYLTSFMHLMKPLT